MKSAKSIIDHIRRLPLHSKVLEIACYEKVKSMLPKHLASAVLFIYKKNHTLYFVLNHPGMKMEFHYKHSLIKTLLNKLKQLDTNCKDIEIREIKSFVSNKAPTTAIAKPVIKRYYVEKSKAVFTNRARNPELHDLFESIRETLKEQQ